MTPETHKPQATEGKVEDARIILARWYGGNAIYVDTITFEDESHGTGQLLVTDDHCRGHFRDEIGIKIFPGHKMIEAAAQTLGLIALGNAGAGEKLPLFQGITGPIDFKKAVRPGEAIAIAGEITARGKWGFVGNARLKVGGREIATICGISAILVDRRLADRLLKT